MTTPKFSHTDTHGAAQMVDVGHKAITQRMAKAIGRIVMNEATFAAIRTNTVAKGDVLSCARIAGIMAAKNTASLIPLCHPLPLSSVTINFEMIEESVSHKSPHINVQAQAQCNGPTGVEMEALTAVSVALLTIYDMAKAIDKAMRIDNIMLLEKHGGKSGSWVRT